MKLEINQLSFAVEKGLAPVYLVSGDEPLQQGEAVDLIRKKARSEGFLNRIVLHVEGKFDWNQLFSACMSQSLFAEKNLIELNLPTAKPGREGSPIIDRVVSELSSDNLLIIIAGKVEKKSHTSKWYKAIDKVGAVITVWPLADGALSQWLKKRLQQKGMSASQQGIKALADSVEGNLLAAAQEIEKLHVLYGAIELTTDNILNAVADNARYDVFKLTDSLLAGNSARTVQVLRGLIGEKLAAPVVLWALMRELRILAGLSFEKNTSGQTGAVFKRYFVWQSKHGAYLKAINRGSLSQWHSLIRACAKADRVTKGAEAGDEWLFIEQICLSICEPNRLKQYGLMVV
ncbi:MAG: DNA polymerase III subunit delta [Cycloclasticus sp.]|nr:DNA polymerase III subunit delta [Cycloclasticus sp.]